MAEKAEFATLDGTPPRWRNPRYRIDPPVELGGSFVGKDPLPLRTLVAFALAGAQADPEALTTAGEAAQVAIDRGEGIPGRITIELNELLVSKHHIAIS